MDFTVTGLYAMLCELGQQDMIFMLFCIAGTLIAYANCFCGYRLLHTWIFLFALVFGAVFGLFFASFITDALLPKAFAVILFAAIFAFFSNKLRDPCTVLFCIVMVFSLSLHLFASVFAQNNSTLYTIIAAVIGIFCGLLVHFLHKPVIILTTSFCGGYTAWISTVAILHLTVESKLNWIIIAVLSFVGIVIQFLSTKKRSRY